MSKSKSNSGPKLRKLLVTWEVSQQVEVMSRTEVGAKNLAMSLPTSKIYEDGYRNIQVEEVIE